MPRLSGASPRREYEIKVRLTPDEMALVKAAASKASVPFAGWIRMVTIAAARGEG